MTNAREKMPPGSLAISFCSSASSDRKAMRVRTEMSRTEMPRAVRAARRYSPKFDGSARRAAFMASVSTSRTDTGRDASRGLPLGLRAEALAIQHVLLNCTSGRRTGRSEDAPQCCGVGGHPAEVLEQPDGRKPSRAGLGDE